MQRAETAQVIGDRFRLVSGPGVHERCRQPRSGLPAPMLASACAVPAAPREPQHTDLVAGAVHTVALAAACYVSYWMTAQVLSQLHSHSAADDMLGDCGGSRDRIRIPHDLSAGRRRCHLSDRRDAGELRTLSSLPSDPALLSPRPGGANWHRDAHPDADPATRRHHHRRNHHRGSS